MRWKYVDIPNYDIIQNKLQGVMKKHHKLLKHGISVANMTSSELVCDITEIEELSDFLHTTNLLKYVVHYVIFVISPGQEYDIHIDGTNVAPFLNESRILLPILNCNGIKTKFYTSTHNSEIVVIKSHNDDQDLYYERFNPEYCTEVDSYELTAPVVINPNYPHKVEENTNNDLRVSLGIAFNKKIDLFKNT